MWDRGTFATGTERANGSSAQGRDARFRAFREGAFVGNFLSQAPLERFWLSDLRRFSLFLYLIRESAVMRGGTAGRFPFALAAMRSQLSLARLSQVLDMACSMGDFTRTRDPRDARQYVFEPSERTLEMFERMVADFWREAPALQGHPGLPMAGEGLRPRMQFIDAMLRFLGSVDLGDRGVGSLSFMLAMFDLRLHSPLATTDLIRRESDRLNVTTVTIRNLLRRAEERGWLHRSQRMLSLSDKGRRRIEAGMEAFEGLVDDVLSGGTGDGVETSARWIRAPQGVARSPQDWRGA